MSTNSVENNTTSPSGDASQDTLDVPLHELLGFEPDDLVSVATNKVRTARTIRADDLEFALEVGDIDSQQDAWIGAQPVEPTLGDKRAKASDVRGLQVLYADFDYKSAGEGTNWQAVIDDLSALLGVKPISVVKSGGGLHPRWRLERLIPREQVGQLLDRWKRAVFEACDRQQATADSVFDLPRVLRLPGTANTKYDDAQVTAEAVDPQARVAIKTLWSALPPLASRKKAKPAAPSQAPVDDAPAPERPILSSHAAERAMRADIEATLARLRKLSEDGWEGEPWHNTTRDAAFRLARIAASENSPVSEDELRQMFLDAAPRDDEGFDDAKVEDLWESGMESAGESQYEVIGSGDDLFADDLDTMLGDIQEQAPAPRTLDIDIEDSAEPTPAPALSERGQGARDRYNALERPLVPGFGGVAALRQIPVDPETTPARLQDRLAVIAEDISDLHAIEHLEYLHPHCPKCFPDDWQAQLNRFLIRNPRVDPSAIRPPLGRLGPDEGYIDGEALLALPDSEMLIEGYLPMGAVGLISGRGATGKTYLAIDIAMSIMDEGVDEWHSVLSASEDNNDGLVNAHGGVYFLVGEGFSGIKSRIAAWLASRGYEGVPDWLSERLTVRAELPNLFTGGAEFDALLRRLSMDKPKLIVVDTLQRATAGADQNSAADMGMVTARLAQMKAAADGATVITIAHSTKDDSSTRGSTAIEDDSDFVLRTKQGDDRHIIDLEVGKMKDGHVGSNLSLVLSPYGNSMAVINADGRVREVEDLSGELAVLAAIYSWALATSFDDDVKFTDIQRLCSDMSQRTLIRRIGELKAKGEILQTQKNKRLYRLSPRGRARAEAENISALTLPAIGS